MLVDELDRLWLVAMLDRLLAPKLLALKLLDDVLVSWLAQQWLDPMMVPELDWLSDQSLSASRLLVAQSLADELAQQWLVCALVYWLVPML
jgi:hypothetical protein